jgi:hypothetical protein
MLLMLMAHMIARMTKLPIRLVGALFVGLLIPACSMGSGDIKAQFVLAEKYQELSCQQIGAEGDRVARRVAEISGAEYDNGGTGLSLISQPIVVRWPPPVAVPEDAAGELGKLKGEFEALERASTLKRCSYSFKQRSN